MVGDVYVAEDGDDNNYGSDWDNPFKSIEKGFAEVSDGRNIYVESGLYSETLANLDVASTNNSCKLVPMNKDHLTNSEAVVVIGNGTKGKTEVSDLESGYALAEVSEVSQWCTHFNSDITYPAKLIQLYSYVERTRNDSPTVVDVRFVQLRPNGVNYDLIAKSDVTQITTTAIMTNITDLYVGLTLQAGDILAIELHFISGSFTGPARNSRTGNSKSIAREITGSTAQSAWQSSTSGLILEMRYFD
jgi:hypothetical protein